MPKSKEPPLPEKIAASLVQKINTGALKPGDRVLEQAIADEFATSRGPVRDAFKILQARNWIDITPRQGARVADLDAPPALETVLIGAVMLGLAFRFAVLKATDAELDAFNQKVKQVIRLGEDNAASSSDFANAATEAGYYAIAIANNKDINEVIGPIPKGALSRFTPASVHDTQTKKVATNLWRELAIAFTLRDSTTAEHLGRQMVESAHERVLRSRLTSVSIDFDLD